MRQLQSNLKKIQKHHASAFTKHERCAYKFEYKDAKEWFTGREREESGGGWDGAR